MIGSIENLPENRQIPGRTLPHLARKGELYSVGTPNRFSSGGRHLAVLGYAFFKAFLKNLKIGFWALPMQNFMS